MILPITIYGLPVLRKVCTPIDKNYPNLKELLENMYATLTHSEGVGLAAPQVNLPIRIFIVDLDVMGEDEPKYKGVKKTFINPVITWMSDETETSGEGCLSLPGINENVTRAKKVRVKYQDEDFVEHEDEFEDFYAKVIQHEYDHLEGKVFIDRISPIRRAMNKGKIESMKKGKVRCHYNVKTV
ncbi:MAG: peptide deformylase [Paludibacteraceae bacterium]|nr:peptide deformylase [Paludibacteraceae bacterium]